MSNAFIASLFTAFGALEVAEKFIVRPPANAGSLYPFKEPFLYTQDDAYTSDTPSDNLTVFMSSFVNAVSAYVAINMNGTTTPVVPGATVNVGICELVFGSPYSHRADAGRQLSEEETDLLVVAVRTPRALVPVCNVAAINQLSKRYQFAAPLVSQRTVRAFEDLQSVQVGDEDGASVLKIDPVNFDTGNTVLASLLESVMRKRTSYSPTILMGLVNAYVEKHMVAKENPAHGTALTREQLAMNLQKQIAMPVINWKTFQLGLRILGVESALVELTVADGGGSESFVHRASWTDSDQGSEVQN